MQPAPSETCVVEALKPTRLRFQAIKGCLAPKHRVTVSLCQGGGTVDTQERVRQSALTDQQQPRKLVHLLLHRLARKLAQSTMNRRNLDDGAARRDQPVEPLALAQPRNRPG